MSCCVDHCLPHADERTTRRCRYRQVSCGVLAILSRPDHHGHYTNPLASSPCSAKGLMTVPNHSGCRSFLLALRLCSCTTEVLRQATILRPRSRPITLAWWLVPAAHSGLHFTRTFPLFIMLSCRTSRWPFMHDSPHQSFVTLALM